MLDMHVIGETFDLMGRCVQVSNPAVDDHRQPDTHGLLMPFFDPHLDADEWIRASKAKREELRAKAAEKLAAVVAENARNFTARRRQKDYGKEWRGRNPEYQRRAWRKWRLAHLADRKAYARAYYLKNKDALLQKDKDRNRSRVTVGHCKGESVNHAVLTAEKVLQIRSRANESRYALAAAFGVSRGAIQHILTRRTWVHV